MIASYALRLVCLSLAVFLLVHTVLGLAIAAAGPVLARAIEHLRPRSAARLLFGLRMLPAAAALFIVLALCVPSYLWLEPEAGAEQIGWLCLFAALAAAAHWAHAAIHLGRTLLRSARYTRYCESTGAPVVMLAGVFRPRLVISRVICEALSPEQLDAALRHEQAHRRAHDNFKRLLLAATPRLPGFAAVEQAWSRVSEWCADDEAAAGDDLRALYLADALVRVARLGGMPAEVALLGDGRDLAHRIERLLHPRTYAPSRRRWFTATAAAALAPIVLIAFHGPTLESAHRLFEQLVH